MLNKYSAKCIICKELIPPGKGVLIKLGTKWKVKHVETCVFKLSPIRSYDRPIKPRRRQSDNDLDSHRDYDDIAEQYGGFFD